MPDSFADCPSSEQNGPVSRPAYSSALPIEVRLEDAIPFLFFYSLLLGK
jgi:hypothetical protein